MKAERLSDVAVTRVAAALLSIALLVSTLSACGGGEKTTAAEPSSSPVTSSSPRGPSSGSGTLYLTDDGPITLDPALAAEAGSGVYISQIFSGLVRLDETLNVASDIAVSWDKSPDGKTFTFHLRSEARFHNGKAVRASDFIYSWERALNPRTGSSTAGTYLIDIVGAPDVLSGKSQALSGVKAIDDKTLQVSIDAPKAYFLYKMAFPTAFVVDRANVGSNAKWWQQPNGTGPFKLRQWQKDQNLVLQRNGDYYGERASVNEVNYKLLAGSSIQLYQSGSIDVSPVGGVYMGLATDPANPVSKELQVFPELSFSYVGFNTRTAPFDDEKVRQAFTLAVDKERIAALAASNIVATAYGILPPGMPGYDAGLTGLRFDPGRARQLIASSKFGDVSKLPPIVLTTAGFGGMISGTVGGVIEEWRRNLGVVVTVRQLEPEAYFSSLRAEKDQLYESAWIADYPDPQNFLDVLFHSGTYNNTGEYSNPNVDSLLDRAGVEQDPGSRLRMYQDAEKMIVQDAAVLPMFFGRSYVLVKPWVSGYIESPLGMPQFNKVVVNAKR